MTVSPDLDREKLNLEIERLKFERQKLAIETLVKRRELRSKKTNPVWERISNPIVLAVAGGFITLMSSIVSSAFTASYTLQADLIKKFVEGTSHEIVRNNLKFLADVGLLPTYDARIKNYLRLNPDSAPQISFSGGIVGQDDAVLLSSLSPSDPLQALGKGVGFLRIKNAPGAMAVCTAFLVRPDIIATAGHCVSPNTVEISFTIDDKSISAQVISTRIAADESASYSLLRLSEKSTILPLKLSTKAPSVGEQLAIVMFRGTPSKLAVRSSDCRVNAVGEESLQHKCDTGAGSSGAPILSLKTGEITAIHSGRNASGGWGTVSTVVAHAVEALQ